MDKTITLIAALVMVLGLTYAAAALATPQEDQAAWQDYFQKRFPDVPREDFVNGVYAIAPVGRENWEAIEEFPPYEMAVSNGEKMWNTPFANGKAYRDCFSDGPAVAGKYPYWDKERGMVVTLPLAINECREANGEKPLKYKKGPIADILSYIRYESRGQITRVEIPNDNSKALEAYEKGKQLYFARRRGRGSNKKWGVVDKPLLL